jgi:pyruvate dehydrogenase E2 component (dihydrolipoamide acetyltransferase)
MRKIIADRMSHSKRTIPHFYLQISCAVDQLRSVRRQLNDKFGYRLTVNDFVVRAAALALLEVPQLNVTWTDTALLPHCSVDVAVSVATPKGLITPVIRDADAKDIPVISREIRELAGRAREGRLEPAEYEGGGLTVTNLGMYGVESMYAVINPPQSCILAIGAAEERAVARAGSVQAAMIMSCTLSCDHRVVDGVAGAEFLRAFKQSIENPAVLLV